MPVDFIDRSDEAIVAMSTAIEAALEAIGNQAVSHAKSNLTSAGRVNTGNLRNSISHVVDNDENTVYIGTNTEYAIYNEFGTGIFAEGGAGRKSPWSYQDENGEWHRTRGMPPVHFLKNAVQDHADEYKRIAEAEIASHQP